MGVVSSDAFRKREGDAGGPDPQGGPAGATVKTASTRTGGADRTRSANGGL